MTERSPRSEVGILRDKDPCDPICDFCTHYRFNGDAEGVYTGDGRCEHPDHPAPREPYDGCDDFECAVCGKTA